MSKEMPKAASARTVLVRKTSKRFNYASLIVVALIAVVIAAAIALGGGEKSVTKSQPKSKQAQVVNTTCGPYRKDGVVTVNGQPINVETAAGSKELIKGLSGRPCIESDWGMLFDFGRDGHYAIWMKSMKFPIDVAWIDSTHKVVALEIDFKPSTYPERRANQSPARYVLEMKANQSKELDLNLGTHIDFKKS